MSGKNQFIQPFNWQSADPAIGFLPTHQPSGSPASGTLAGTMSGTAVIYTNIIDVAKMDSIGLEVSWTSTAHGTLEVQGSNSGINWFTLTFDPALAQPAGTAGAYGIDLQQYPFKYLRLKYTNASSSGTITVYCQFKDLN